MDIYLRLALVALVLFAAAPASAVPKGTPPHYGVTDLGIDLRTSESGPVGINNAGDIAGTLDASPTSSEHRAFLYHRGKVTVLSDRDLRGAAINNSGQVACFSRSTAFLWEKGRMRPIPIMLGPFGFGSLMGDLYVNGLNDRGQVIGNIFGLDGVFLPFLWPRAQGKAVFPATTDQTRSVLGSLSNFRFEPRAINNHGQIVGFTHRSMGGGPPAHAVLWDNGTVHEVTGLSAILPAALNNRGQVVGMMYVGTRTHAFAWDGAGVVRDLGTAGGDDSEADGIDDKGQIIGKADIHYEEVHGLDRIGWGGSRAILWQDNGAYNLNDLIPQDAGWVLEQATAINGRGQIVGTGYHSRDGGKSKQGGLRVFLLTLAK